MWHIQYVAITIYLRWFTYYEPANFELANFELANFEPANFAKT